MTQTLRRGFVPIAAAALAAVLPAQVQEAPILHVDSRPMLLVTLRAGERTYRCNLLVDLTATSPLFLHRNAAGSLRSPTADVEAGSIKLEGLPVEARRDRWLEGLTARFATELKEVPVAGILGIGAFRGRSVVLDGPGKLLRISPAAGAIEDPPAAAGRAVIQLPEDPFEAGVVIPVELGSDVRARFVLNTREPFCSIEPALAIRAGAPDGALRVARTGTLNFAASAPFRPLAAGGKQGGIGGALLAQMVVTLHPDSAKLVLDHVAPLAYPKDEAELYAAMYGDEGTAALARFVAERKDSRFLHEAAQALLDRALAGGPPVLETVRAAALAAMDAVRADGTAREGLALVDKMNSAGADLDPLREELLKKALAAARSDMEGDTGHKLRLALGVLERSRGNAKEAHRHLLSAVFGMPTNGTANLELGRLYEATGELERARGRYFLALLDAEGGTAVPGLLALTALHKKTTGGEAGLAATLMEMSEGKIPAFHPLPREADAIKPTGRIVLAELFTGAECPPCAAADVAFDALGEHYGPEEIAIIEWHLPIPAPEPLVSGVSQARGAKRGVRGTPTAVFGGTEILSGGGEAKDGGAVFEKYTKLLEPLLAKAPQGKIGARAWSDAKDVHVEAWVEGARTDLRLHAVLCEDLLLYPGRNGILFHRHVARAAFTPAAGVAAEEAAPWLGKLSLAEVSEDLGRTADSLGSFEVKPTRVTGEGLAVVLFLEDQASGEVVQARSVVVGKGGEGLRK